MKAASTRENTRDMIYVAMFAIIIAICSWISVPATVPFTLQTFGVFAIRCSPNAQSNKKEQQCAAAQYCS